MLVREGGVLTTMLLRGRGWDFEVCYGLPARSKLEKPLYQKKVLILLGLILSEVACPYTVCLESLRDLFIVIELSGSATASLTTASLTTASLTSASLTSASLTTAPFFSTSLLTSRAAQQQGMGLN